VTASLSNNTPLSSRTGLGEVLALKSHCPGPSRSVSYTSLSSQDQGIIEIGRSRAARTRRKASSVLEITKGHATAETNDEKEEGKMVIQRSNGEKKGPGRKGGERQICLDKPK
jgi:hypothetical protein